MPYHSKAQPKSQAPKGVRKPHAKSSQKFEPVESSRQAAAERLRVSARVRGKKVERKVPRSYVPASLTGADRQKQVESIVKGKKRPEVKSFKSKRSPWAKKLEDRYGFTVRSKKLESLISREGIRQILDKGRGAYYSSGSRPNQTADSWAYARLASVVMGGPARKVDRAIWEKYRK
jgi:hypothetical protein